MRLGDLVTGGVVVAGAALILWASAGLPPMPGQRFGPGTFPTVIGCVMAASGGIIAWRGWQARRGATHFDIGALADDPRARLAALWLVLGLVVIILAWRPVGFPLLAALHGGGFMAILGIRPWKAAIWGIATAVLVHLAFTRLLLVPLPAGPLSVLL